MKRIVNLLKFNRVLFQGHREQLSDESEDDPAWVLTTKSSERIVDFAKKLASEEREDNEAVKELAGAAGRHRNQLVVARRYYRVGGWYRENRLDNRAERLLQAALSGTPVLPPSEGDETLLSALEELRDMNPADAFRRLAEKEPGLDAVQFETIRGDLPPSPVSHLDGLSSNTDIRMRLQERLAPLIGPESGSTDEVLRSNTALELTIEYLAPPRE